MVAKAQGQELRKGVLGSLLRNLSTVIGLKLLLLPREQRLHVDEPLGPSWQRWRPRQYETVCLTQIQIIDYDSFFRLQNILPHILPHIKIRVTVVVS